MLVRELSSTINSYEYLSGLMVCQRMVPWMRVSFELVGGEDNPFCSLVIISEENNFSRILEFFGIKSSEVRTVGGS